MKDGLAGFVSRWVYDLRRVLESHLDGLKEDLYSDDEETRDRASEQVTQILDWLYPPLPKAAPTDTMQSIARVMADETLSPKERVAAVRRAARSTGRRRGRPRTNTSQQAITALSMHYATNMSWRKIALTIRGCKHKRPNPELSCRHCGDAIRDAAGRLENFLKSIGWTLDFPPGRELSELTQSDLLKLWNSTPENSV